MQVIKEITDNINLDAYSNSTIQRTVQVVGRKIRQTKFLYEIIFCLRHFLPYVLHFWFILFHSLSHII
jgi:hypothetical protein